MSNSLDPDQARHFVGPDLGPNCLKKVTADGPSRHVYYHVGKGNTFRYSSIVWIFTFTLFTEKKKITRTTVMFRNF